MPRSPQDIYARHLSSLRGYPLWTPEPSQQLLAFRRDGLRIGDVGVVIPEDGCFDVFFNICLPQDHPFHRATGVPDNFTPVKLDDMDVRTVVDAENPGRILSSSSVKSVRTVNRSADRSSSGVDYEFSLSSSEGALLILPEGAERRDLRNHHCFLEMATRHGANWYRFAEERVGQIISNNSLYLITGLHKTTSWSLAAFEKAAGTAVYPAQFRLSQAGRDSVAATYTWDTTRALDWRVGPRDNYGMDNQSVFIRGFKVALRTGMFGTRRISVRADAPSTRPNPVRSLGAIKRGSRLAYTFGGLSAGRTVQPSGGGSQDEAAAGSALEDAQNEIQNNGAFAVGEHVVIQRIPEASQAFHPSDGINQYLLNKEPSATIAITHDDVWITMLEENLLQSEDLVQEGRLETLASQNYDVISKEGAVYLQSRSSNKSDISVVNRVDESMVGRHLQSKDSLHPIVGSPPLYKAQGRFSFNVLVVGEAGVGKSSVVNLIAGEQPTSVNFDSSGGTLVGPPSLSGSTLVVPSYSSRGTLVATSRDIVLPDHQGLGHQLATVDSGVGGCTLGATSYDIVLPDHQGLGHHVHLFETIGLPEPSLSESGYLSAIQQANALICRLQRTGGIQLLLFCIRGDKITSATQNNYRLFCDILCQNQVPVALVITGLENESSMEEWWERNASSFEQSGLSCSSHVCITTTRGRDGRYEEQYRESQMKIRSMLLAHITGGSMSRAPERVGWYTRLTGRLSKWPRQIRNRRQGASVAEKLARHLQDQCHLSQSEAKQLAAGILAVGQEP